MTYNLCLVMGMLDSFYINNMFIYYVFNDKGLNTSVTHIYVYIHIVNDHAFEHNCLVKGV
jgi:hypothetical protein